jgi:crotonobetainyl-CoA:carnitine CoA-transferase CaiB-like acyl-CoA transferase
VPDGHVGSLPMHDVVPRLSATPGALRRPAPALGEHNAELLRELGYDSDAITQL